MNARFASRARTNNASDEFCTEIVLNLGTGSWRAVQAVTLPGAGALSTIEIASTGRCDHLIIGARRVGPLQTLFRPERGKGFWLSSGRHRVLAWWYRGKGAPVGRRSDLDVGTLLLMLGLSYAMGPLWYDLLQGRLPQQIWRVAAYPFLGVFVAEARPASVFTFDPKFGNLQLLTLLIGSLVAVVVDWIIQQARRPSLVLTPESRAGAACIKNEPAAMIDRTSLGGEKVAVYEFECARCGERFELTRPMSEHDKLREHTPTCPKCGASDTHQLVSVFSCKTSSG